jgi:hypothetical protein
MLGRFGFYIILAAIPVLILASCNTNSRKLAEAEKAFDSGDFETAQFVYYELISTAKEAQLDRVVESYYQRVQKLVTSSTFDPATYPEWVALLDSKPEKKKTLDSLFTETIIKRAEELLKDGETVESAVLIGYIPEGQDDAGMTEKIAQAHDKKQEDIFNKGFNEYKNHKFDIAIETWKKLDMTSELGKKAEEIKTKIPAEKEAFYLSEAKKRKVEGIKITASGPVNRVVFNRIQGKTLETEAAGDGRQILRIEATLTKNIELYAWYKDGGEFKSLGTLRREFVWLEAQDPDKIKKMYKQVITPENPAQVVYFLNTEYDFCKYHPVYISTEGIPRIVDELVGIAIVHIFK